MGTAVTMAIVMIMVRIMAKMQLSQVWGQRGIQGVKMTSTCRRSFPRLRRGAIPPPLRSSSLSRSIFVKRKRRTGEEEQKEVTLVSCYATMPRVRMLINPRRVMPEVPENMQDNIAQMEHGAYDARRAQPQSPAQYASRSQFPERTSSTVHSQPQQAETYDHGAYAQSATYDSMDHPNFSPFPVLRNPPPNVPPTDEQREASLERARMAVLSTTDPEMQLAWAQDALAFVEVAAQNEARLCTIQPPRPHTPQFERQLRTDAMNIVNFLAGQQHPKAEFIKGMWLEFGKFGYRIDRKEAFRAYTRAAEKGYARAEYRIGMQFESSGEPEKAIRHYERGVAMADSASYYVRGEYYVAGGDSRVLTRSSSSGWE